MNKMFLLILLLPIINSVLLFYIRLLNIRFMRWLEWLIVLLIFNEIIINDEIVYLDLINWFNDYKISFVFDKVSVTLMILIMLIYNQVIIYSLYYMSEDKNIRRFLIYLYLFVLSMLILVLSKNIIVLLIGWEWVGIMSYLLISFWNINISNVKSGIKAILYNKLGDVGILLILLTTTNLNKYYILFFIIASMAKSAQILFTGWLTSAMSGPTPVSSLLHSSTMVTAGIYLLIRYNVNDLGLFNNDILNNNISLNIFNILDIDMSILSMIGLITLIYVSLLGIISNDIKNIIALSTCSQLGYLFYSYCIGINYNYNHLFIHGFFKALLFISAGYIIHKINMQDLRKYGNLIYNLPVEYIFILISSLSLIAIPFLSGFYTKELLINYSYNNYIHNYILSVIGSLLTSLYSIRLLYLTFYNRPNVNVSKYFINQSLNNNTSNSINLHNNYFYLSILIIGSTVLGYFINIDYHDIENLSLNIKLLPLYLFIISLFIINKIRFNSFFYIDELYNRLTIYLIRYYYYITKIIEKHIFDYIWII